MGGLINSPFFYASGLPNGNDMMININKYIKKQLTFALPFGIIKKVRGVRLPRVLYERGVDYDECG